MKWGEWGSDLLDKVATGAGDLVDAYKEAEVDKVKNPEPQNAANAAPANPTATAAKYNETAAVANQQANAATVNDALSFVNSNGKWFAIGGGTLVVLGVLILAVKSKGR